MNKIKHAPGSASLFARPPRFKPRPPISPHWDWPAFWAPVQAQLKACRYRGSTRKLYRNVLRGFRSHCRCRPAEVTRRHVREHLHELGRRGLSSSWIGTNVSV